VIKTQAQLPDSLYEEVKCVARGREISLAEVMRRGLEHIVKAYLPILSQQREGTPPTPRSLGSFQAPPEDWRYLVNDPSGLSKS